VLPWRQWPHVRRGDAVNVLRLECRDEACVFYVKEEATAQIDVDGSIDAIGLAAWCYAVSMLSVAFEHIRVWR